MPYGIVTQTKAGFIKADVPEMDYETDWIPIINLMSKTNKSQFNLAIGTQVFVLNEYNSSGELHSQICMGTTNSDVEAAPFSKEKDGILYADTTEISYDTSTKTLTINSANVLDLEGITVNIGVNPSQAMVSLTTLNAFLTVVNTVIAKIPTPPTGAELSALTSGLSLLAQGIPSIKTPLL